jgi:hypothetical protein
LRTLQAEVTQAVTISSRVVNNAGLEYLNLGRDGQEEKHRFLIQFDLARARGRLLSATLQLFLVSAGNKEDNLQHTLEVYPITSTEWHESNTTSVVPWNKDYLGIDEDVDKSRYLSVYIQVRVRLWSGVLSCASMVFLRVLPFSSLGCQP